MLCRKLLPILIGCLYLLQGCDLIEYHPYDARIDGKIHINVKNVVRIEQACVGKDTVRFAVISDTQRYYDETRDMVSDINRRSNIDFVLHCGDLSDFGITKEFLWQRDILEKLKCPYVCLLGNHDCLGTGEHVFEKVFGTPNFAFTAGNVRFVCLNTNAREYDYTVPVPDFSFLLSEQKNFPSQARKTIVAMHAKPGSEQFNNNVNEMFEYCLLQFPGLLFSLCGHDHHTSVEDLFDDGNIYYECNTSGKKEYLLFQVYENGYTYEVLHL